jgi:4-amino-4-deoxy-L-arabinose transferase-like glycosyltransferase
VSPRLAIPALLALWGLLLAVALEVRPLLPVNETRYVGVAWEMWLRGDFLVPYLNGEPYSHKPPLLFWLIQAGWAVFGVNEWWPRLVVPLVSLGVMALAVRLARLLWPEDRRAADLMPWLLLGGLLWPGFYTMVQFDLLLTGAVLLALIGLVHAWQGRAGGWGWVGLGIGLGVLAKGPVVVLHVLPVALLAPWWARERRPPSWPRWYGGLSLALLLGAAIGLAWAWPAALAGGEAYRQAIFFGQHTGRIGAEAPHAEPWWLYLALLPVMLAPWSLWPRVWQGLGVLARDDRWRLCLAWALPVVLLFCLVAGKQGKYLLPMFPALLLLAAHGLSRWHGGRQLPERLWVPGLLALVGGLGLALVHLKPTEVYWLPLVDGRWGWVLAAWGLWLLGRRVVMLETKVMLAAATSVAMYLALHLTALRAMAPTFDMRPMSQALAQHQAAGLPLATTLDYQGEFHFLGRLREPLLVLRSLAELRVWAERHPGGYAVLREGAWRGGIPEASLVQHHRSGALVLVQAGRLDAYLAGRP